MNTDSDLAYAQEEDVIEPIIETHRTWTIPIAAALIALAAITGVTYDQLHTTTPTTAAQSAVTAPLEVITPAEIPAINEPDNPTEAQSLNIDSRFVGILKAEGWVFSVDDDQVAAEGHQVCKILNNGTSLTELANNSAQSSGIEPSHARQFDITAADIYCPQNSPQ